MYRQSLGELNARIAAARATLDRRAQLVRLQRALDEERAELSAAVVELSTTVTREKQDVERLQGTSLSSLLHTLLGDREAKLDEERRAWMEAILRYQEAQRALDAALQRRAEITAELQDLAHAERELERLLEEKARWLDERGAPVAEELFVLAEEAGRLKALIDGIDQTLERGATAQIELFRVVVLFQEAEDMQGKLVTDSTVGHDSRSKLQAAVAQLEPAQLALAHFERELAEVLSQLPGARRAVPMRRSLGFAGLLERARDQPRQYFEQIMDTLAAYLETLQHQRAELRARMDDVEAKRRDLLERWG